MLDPYGVVLLGGVPFWRNYVTVRVSFEKFCLILLPLPADQDVELSVPSPASYSAMKIIEKKQ